MTEPRRRGWLADLRDGLAYPLTSNRRLLLAAVATVVTYSVLVLSAFPQFAVQILTRDPAQFGYAVTALSRQLYLGTGWLGVALVAAYALLTGVAVTNAVTLLRRARRGGASTLAGVVPGLLAAGCASCGAGVLGTLGLLGAMAALPFEGNLLRVGGILLLAYFLGRTGDPRTCSIEPSR
ncbi:hypothetical protein [Halolamina rubra]|uniref:hypothetical protein n=1 Tax=Halolamina rubra TaxID=1380430 RepID=UPI000678CC37|nr:hypothetical protein [Halolamina rubra]